MQETPQGTWVRSLGWEDPLEEGIPTAVFLPGESSGQRSLAGYIQSLGLQRVGHRSVDALKHIVELAIAYSVISYISCSLSEIRCERI